MNNLVKKFPRNMRGRDFVVSDMHGCYKDFIEKLENVEFDSSVDRVFSVGDLCDRGPESIKCLSLIDEDWFHSVMGNHEWLWLRAHDEFHKLNLFNEGKYPHEKLGDYHVFISNGGEIVSEVDDTFLEFFKRIMNLPLAIEVETKNGKNGIIHAELPFDDWNRLYDVKPDEMEKAKEFLMWGRSMCMFTPELGKDYTIKNIDRVYAGHTVVPEVMAVENRVYIDTGSFLKYRHPNKVYSMKKKGYELDITLLEI